MLDHLSGGRVRVRHRARRGQPRDPRLPPRHGGPDRHAATSGRTSIREFPKMWMQDEYQGYEGKYWSLPPRKILPKPYVKPHPPMWYAAGNTVELRDGRALRPRRARLLGRQHRRAEAGRSRRTSGEVANAEPIGAFVNDNVMVTVGGVRAPRTAEARGREPWRTALDVPAEQRVPLPRHVPAPRLGAARGPSCIPELTIDEVVEPWSAPAGDDLRRPRRRARGSARSGRRRRRPARASAWAWRRQEETLETIRLIGEHVIPKIDTDPEHRTTRLPPAKARRSDPSSGPSPRRSRSERRNHR